MSTIAAQDHGGPARSDSPSVLQGMSELPRFPVDAWGWDELTAVPPLPKPRIVGNHAYDLVINHRSRRPVTRTMRRLMTAFPEDFTAASELLEPVHWRLLFYLDLFPLAALGTPSFDARQAISEIYYRELVYLDVPSAWIGTDTPVRDLLGDVRARVSDTTDDTAKATYAILGFASSLGFEQHEVLAVPFWKTWWIEQLLIASGI